MKQPTAPPLTRFLQTHKCVEIYVFDAQMGHTRPGWNHHQDRFCIVQWDPFERADRGLVGDDLDDVLAMTLADIDKRKNFKLN